MLCLLRNLLCIVFCLSVPTFAIAENGQLERTQAAERLQNSVIDMKSREAFAAAILNYCTETSKNLPVNSQKEDDELEKALAGPFDIKRIEKIVETIEYSRRALQKALSQCTRISGDIVRRSYTTRNGEAILWVNLEGVFDSTIDLNATKVGILRIAENGHTISDLHGIQSWPLVRIGIRNGSILPLLLSQ